MAQEEETTWKDLEEAFTQQWNCTGYPSVSSAPDEGVISVDVSRHVLVDSMTDMSETLTQPDIIASVDVTTDNEEENGKLTLAYERLYEIPKTIVERFSEHIKYLDISHNKITNLDALVYFKSLTSLIADDNPITESCFLPPLPKLELLCYPSVSSAPDEGVISVDVSRHVLVDSMTDMSETLTQPDIIASVDVTTDNEEENGKLTLAYERLYEIPKTIVERFSEHIKYLDISHNKITNLDALVYFKSLTSLIADDNPITESCFLPPLPKLELLWLNRCSIASLYPWVGKLKESCPNLQYLSLMGNPAAPSYFNGGTFYEYLQYRLFIISQFPSLYHLDDRRVTEDQRLEAQRLYKRPFFERLVKPAGLSHLVNSSVTWNSVQNKITALWSKDKQGTRNLLI